MGGTTGLLAGGAANSSVGLAGMLLQGDRLDDSIKLNELTLPFFIC